MLDASHDLDGRIVAWAWSFGDGTGSTERSPSHVFAKTGTYTVQLTVRDDEGLQGAAQRACRTFVHLDNLGCGADGHSVRRDRADAAQGLANIAFATHEDHARVWRLFKKLDRCNHDDGRAMIATHRIDGYADAHRFSSDAS